MTNPMQTPAMSSNKRGPTAYVAAGCALLALCAVCGAAIAGWQIFSRRGELASQPAVEYVLDASPRMAQAADTSGGTRLAVAQGVLDEIVRPSDPAVRAGLRVFGSGKLAEGCADTDLLVPLALGNQAKIFSSLLAVVTGSKLDAAMASAVVAALHDLAATRGPHTLVVVTGGSDTCNAQAGQLIAAEAKRDGIDYQLFVVGFQVPDDQGVAVSGLVDSAGHGHYINAHSKNELTTVLTAIQQYVSNPKTTTVAGVLATAAALPTPTIPPPATRAPATATPAVGLTACDNPFMPLRPGSTWTYSFSNGGSATWTVAGVTGDASQAVAHLTIGGGANILSGDWQCSGAGIAKYDFPVWFTAALGQKLG